MNLLTISQMAERYNLSVRTFRKYILDLGIPHKKLGRNLRFDPSKVDAFLEVQNPRREKMEFPGRKHSYTPKQSKSEFAGIFD